MIRLFQKFFLTLTSVSWPEHIISAADRHLRTQRKQNGAPTESERRFFYSLRKMQTQFLLAACCGASCRGVMDTTIYSRSLSSPPSATRKINLSL